MASTASTSTTSTTSMASPSPSTTAAPSQGPSQGPSQALAKLPHLSEGHVFQRPAKRIFDEQDVTRFLRSLAYRDIGLFILQLNHALCPRTTAGGTGAAVLPTAANTTVFTLQAPSRSDDAPSVQRLRQLLDRVSALVEAAPPSVAPRRFGNVSFRKWHALLGEQAEALLEEYVPVLKREKKKDDNDDDEEESTVVMDEVLPYFLGAFGSAQRLDYGTGHELSFLAFLGCLWKLGVFDDGDPGPDNEAVERMIVLGVIEPYLLVVRKLIRTYTLEPAGSHGVWGLDDHSFLPFIFGSAQLTRPLVAGPTRTPMPQMGSAPHVPRPADIIQPAIVAAQRPLNLYFSAIGFIYDVKTGAFWEHSSMLFDISGIRDGWGKVNKGMIKMYNAEVLSKFPVVQHFPFGSMFSWEEDPEAVNSPASTQPMAAPIATPRPTPGMHLNMATDPVPGIGTGTTAAPWAHAGRMPRAPPHPAAHPGMPMRVPFLPALPTRRDRQPNEDPDPRTGPAGQTGQTG